MSINQNDLRVIKTKQGFREALFHLLLEKGYDAISIQDLALEAQAARVTFYRHYRDKEELLIDCLNQVYEELLARVQHITNEENQLMYSPMLVLYNHFREKEKYLKILFSSQSAQFLIERIKQLLAERTKIRIEERFSANQQLAPLELIANHIASAQIGLLVWWFENGQPYSPEYMAQISVWLSFAGNARGLGFDQFSIDPPPIQEK